jgi:hypothetical protein
MPGFSTGSQAPAWESFIQDKTQSYQIITFPSLSLGTSIKMMPVFFNRASFIINKTNSKQNLKKR